MLNRFAQSLRTANRRWPKLTALIMGAASATGFEPLGWLPVTLVALALLLVQIAAAPTARRAFGLGWAFGVGHFAVGLNWIATAFTFQAAMPAWLGWVAVVLLSLYLAVYPALAAWAAWLGRRALAASKPKARDANAQHRALRTARERLTAGLNELFHGDSFGVSLPFLLLFMAAWIATEWLRSWMFTGFAWNPLSAVLVVGPVPIASMLQWLGTYGVSALVILNAWLICLLLFNPKQPPYMAHFFLASGILVQILLGVAAGSAPAPAPASAPGPTPITIVQPNVGQQDKWKGEKADANFAKLANLTRPLNRTPRLILWPEAAIPDYLEPGYPWVYYDRSPEAARARLTALMNPGDRMLLGALKLEMDRTGEVVGARNAVMLVRPDGSLGPRYDKAHLVPYGEYLPMRPLLSAIGLSRLTPGDLDFWPGPGPRSLDTNGFGLAGIQICYEIIFSGQVVDRANRPNFIFNPSNDAWFGSWGPPQHLAQARLRAIEEGLPVIRSTPTGISAIIGADGRIIRSLPMGVAARIDGHLPPPHNPTLFARYGNILSLLFAGLLFLLAIASARLRR